MKQKFVIITHMPAAKPVYYVASYEYSENVHDAKQFDHYEAAQEFINVVLITWEGKDNIYQIDKIFVP
jgi:hypothetical protein